MNDFNVFWGFDDGRTNERTNERTLVVVESLSRLKIIDKFAREFHPKDSQMLLIYV